jgi:hypothetical protein
MKKIILTESQLKKLVTRHKLSENLDMEDDGKYPLKWRYSLTYQIYKK